MFYSVVFRAHWFYVLIKSLIFIAFMGSGHLYQTFGGIVGLGLVVQGYLGLMGYSYRGPRMFSWGTEKKIGTTDCII